MIVKISLIIIGIVAALTLIIARLEDNRLEVNGQKFNYQLADSSQDRAKGLSGRDHLPEDDALVFVFDQPGSHGIWMKDMKFAIDIVWLDEQKKVVDLETNVSPDTFPESFKPESPAFYVVEMNAGTAQNIKLGVGDAFEF